MEPEVVCRTRDRCGESPRWESARGNLWWVDNEGATVHRLGLGADECETFTLPSNASSLALTSGSELVITLPDGVHVLAPDGTVLDRWLAMDPGDERCSFNDSGCDARGRLWIGSGSEQVRGQGKLWRATAESATAAPVIDGLSLSNGIGFSPDNRLMYLADSLAGAVYRIPYDLETGELGELDDVLCAVEESEGLPDGLAVDAEGGVWLALWGAGVVRRYAPSGTATHEVRLPVRQVAGCAFGGPGLTDLYVTSARTGLSAEDRRSQPLAGALFRVETDVPGVAIGAIPSGCWGMSADLPRSAEDAL